MTHKVNKHSVACDCSVCWAHHHCDALQLFPDPQPLHTPPFPVNYREFKYMDYSDCNMRSLTPLSGRKAQLCGRDLSGP